MLRKIIQIDQGKCNGCGLCAQACHEGAISMVDGKARLVREDYCDGLGDCLPACPAGAITFQEREAAAYDQAAVRAHLDEAGSCSAGGCPGGAAHTVSHGQPQPPIAREDAQSELTQWPVQIKLAPLRAPYFDNAKLLIAADCTAFAYGNFHQDYIRGHITLIGCPKLDAGDYSEKLTEIIRQNAVRNVTVVRMEVPCCGGIVHAVASALQNSGKMIPWQVVTLSTDGTVLE